MTLKANVTALKTDMKTIKDQNKATDKKTDEMMAILVGMRDRDAMQKRIESRR
jgi:hypothetical protein